MLGDSAGRSGRNRQGAGATRRATPRERQQIDPPREKLTPVYLGVPDLLQRNVKPLLVVTFGSGVGVGLVLSLFVR